MIILPFWKWLFFRCAVKELFVMHLLWIFFFAIILQFYLFWITVFGCKKKGLQKKNGKKGKTGGGKDDPEDSSDSEEEKGGGKKKAGKGKVKGGKKDAAKKGKKGNGKKTETQVTEDPDLKSRDDYAVNTNDESTKNLKK